MTSSLQSERDAVRDLEMKIKRVERTIDENRRENEEQEELLKSKVSRLSVAETSICLVFDLS